MLCNRGTEFPYLLRNISLVQEWTWSVHLQRKCISSHLTWNISLPKCRHTSCIWEKKQFYFLLKEYVLPLQDVHCSIHLKETWILCSYRNISLLCRSGHVPRTWWYPIPPGSHPLHRLPSNCRHPEEITESLLFCFESGEISKLLFNWAVICCHKLQQLPKGVELVIVFLFSSVFFLITVLH